MLSLAGLGQEQEQTCQDKVKCYFWKMKEKTVLMRFNRKSIDNCYRESGKITAHYMAKLHTMADAHLSSKTDSVMLSNGNKKKQSEDAGGDSNVL